jgi:hypothetical protein
MSMEIREAASVANPLQNFAPFICAEQTESAKNDPHVPPFSNRGRDARRIAPRGGIIPSGASRMASFSATITLDFPRAHLTRLARELHHPNRASRSADLGLDMVPFCRGELAR